MTGLPMIIYTAAFGRCSTMCTSQSDRQLCVLFEIPEVRTIRACTRTAGGYAYAWP